MSLKLDKLILTPTRGLNLPAMFFEQPIISGVSAPVVLYDEFYFPGYFVYPGFNSVTEQLIDLEVPEWCSRVNFELTWQDFTAMRNVRIYGYETPEFSTDRYMYSETSNSMDCAKDKVIRTIVPAVSEHLFVVFTSLGPCSAILKTTLYR